MARKKMKKKAKIMIALISLVMVVAITITLYLLFNKEPKEKPLKVVESIDKYGYTLTENETKLYKMLFKKLENELKKDEVDYENYASLIAQLFIADFYDLNSKIAKTDIGGLQFINKDIKDNLIIKAEETFYKYVENNLDGKRTQILPAVKSITVDSVNPSKYAYNDKDYQEAYEVNLTWEYEQDLGYETSTKMIIIRDDKILSIIELD